MTRLIYIIISVLLLSCGKEKSENKEKVEVEFDQKKSPVELGQELFDDKGNCFACHKPDQKIIGPSIIEIAEAYKGKPGLMVDFLKENAPPIVDPEQYETMKTNFAITKEMSDEELQALEAYILSHAK